jgi:hypothetical protein
MHQTDDPEPLGSERYERLVREVDDRFEKVDTLVGSRVLRWIEESGLDLDSAFQAVHSLHGRGLTCERKRRHKLTSRGRELMRKAG